MKTDGKDTFFVIDYETTGVRKADVPIEVGVVVTDAEWNTLEEFAAMIASPEAAALSERRWEEGYRYHGILQGDVGEIGLAPATVAGVLKALAGRYAEVRGRRPILLSDNIQFEWRHTDWLLGHLGLEVPEVFHYCGWDTSVLSLFTPFRDPQGVPHRALPDARLLVEELRRTASLVNPNPS